MTASPTRRARSREAGRGPGDARAVPRVHDSLAGSRRCSEPSAYLARLDTVIASTITARGLDQAWSSGGGCTLCAAQQHHMPERAPVGGMAARGSSALNRRSRSARSQVRSLVGSRAHDTDTPGEIRWGTRGKGVAISIVMIDSRLRRWMGGGDQERSASTCSPPLAASIATVSDDLLLSLSIARSAVTKIFASLDLHVGWPAYPSDRRSSEPSGRERFDVVAISGDLHKSKSGDFHAPRSASATGESRNVITVQGI